MDYGTQAAAKYANYFKNGTKATLRQARQLRRQDAAAVPQANTDLALTRRRGPGLPQARAATRIAIVMRDSGSAPARPGASATTRTFLFSDIEGSTKLLQRLADDYPRVLAEHRQLHFRGGRRQPADGSSDPRVTRCSASSARHPTRCSRRSRSQRALGDHDVAESVKRCACAWACTPARRWPPARTSSAWRCTRWPESSAPGTVARCSCPRLRAACSVTLPAGLGLRDLGERRLKDLAGAEHLYQLTGDGLLDALPAAAHARRQAAQPARPADQFRRRGPSSPTRSRHWPPRGC